MRIAFNPSTVAALTTPPNNKDITFDLRGRNIFARGVEFKGTDTWRPVVDNLTSDSTTSSLSAKQGKTLKALIDGKSNSGHTHAWNSLTHSSTTANQAILTNGSANGWKLYTLNISAWDNAANKAHSHSNKTVLDGITSALVSSWNTAYNFVDKITKADTDKVINKWDEIVNFLAGIDSNNKLNTLLNSKLSIQQLAANDILTTKTNNALFWVNTMSTAGSIPTGPFTDHPYALLSVTNYSQNATNSKFFYRSRLAFSSIGDIKVASCHHQNEYKQDETWYNVLTSKNSGISGSTIKLNGSSITVYSSDTADNRYLKLTGGVLTGNLTGTSATFSGRFHNSGDDEGIIIKPASNGFAGLTLGTHNGERSVFYFIKGNPFWRYNNGSATFDIKHPKKSGIIALTSDLPSKGSWNYDDRYLRLTGGTMQLGEGLKFHADENYFGTYSDARIISLLDDNDKVCDGGLIIDERGTLDGKEYVTELLRIRDSEFKWKGSNILHSSNSYVTSGKGVINGTEITQVNNANKWTTARSFTIGNTSKSVDGSSNVSWSLSEIGAASSSHNHDGRYAISENYGGFKKSGRLPISGFYQSYESESGGNAPWKGWVHLINCQHSNPENNYALQIAANFNDNNVFKIRVTANNVNNTWRNIIHSGNIDSQIVKGAYMTPLTLSDTMLISSGYLASDYTSRYDTQEYMKAAAKYLQKNYSGQSIFGTMVPNSQGFFTANIYSNGFNSNGYPEHITIHYYPHGGTIVNCGTAQGSWYYSSINRDGSSYKLQTARKLWGQSFDGTADVSGTLSGVANIQFSANNAYDIGSNGNASRYIYTHWLGSRSGQKLELGANNSGYGQGLCIDTNLNVGIGTNTPGEKLDVRGNGYFTDHVVARSSGSSWLDGQRYNQAGYNLQDVSGTGSYYPWMRQTNTGSAKWFSIGILNNSFYILGSKTSRTENSYDYAWRFDLSNGWAYGNFSNADTVDGYHENSFLRYRGATTKDQEATLWSQIGIKEYHKALPDSLTSVYNFGSVISLPGPYSRFEIYASHQSSAGNGLYYRSGWENDKQPWRKFIDSSNIGSQSVNYANSAGSASSAEKTRALKYTGTGSNEITAHQTDASYMGRSGWASYIICNHGDGSTYYSQTIAMPFRSSPIYRRLEGGTDRGWKKFYTEEAPPSWDNVTNKPSTFTPASHTHTWTSITDKMVAGNEFNIVNAGFKGGMWFNYLPINNRDSTATIQGYHFGNGAKGHTSVTASSFVKNGGDENQLLRADGGVATFTWSGQSGQPTWLWGGNSQHSYYVYNPSNFSVKYAASAGAVAWDNVTGRPSSLKNPYSLNIFGVAYDGSAAKTVTTSTFISQVSEGTSTITDGTMLITSWASNDGFADTNAVNVPYKRKAIHLWEYIKAKTDILYSSKSHTHSYLPLAGGTMNGNARIGHGSGNLYIGNSGNDGWIYTQDIASQLGTDKWNIRTSGAACFGIIHIASKTDGTFNSNIIECNSTIHLNYFSAQDVSLCYGGGKVGIGKSDPLYTLDVAGNGRFQDFVYCNAVYSTTLNHTSSTGHLVIGNKTKEISIRSSNLPDLNALYLNQKFSTNVYYSANKGFGIRPYYLSNALLPTETVYNNKYSVLTVGDEVQAISCIIADKTSLMSGIKGTLIRFMPGDDGQIVLLKDLNNYGVGSNGYFWVQPKGCSIIRSDNSNVYIADGNISSSYDDGGSRFFIYAKTHKVWIEFFCS